MKRAVLLKDINSLLNNMFPDTIGQVILFGSNAKGKINSYSDYDILVVLKSKSDWRTEDKIINACYAIDLKYNIITDVKVISGEELNSPLGMQPYIQQAIQHGIAL
ncbi:MAG: nucleotidyltransferase domain-containing protein [Bacteroidales bacterium]